MKREDAEELEQKALNLLGDINTILKKEGISPKEDRLYVSWQANFLSNIEAEIQQAWIHLGRLVKRFDENRD